MLVQFMLKNVLSFKDETKECIFNCNKRFK